MQEHMKMKMEILEWAQENVPATAGVLMAELHYQYSEEVEVDSEEMDASMEREWQVWKLVAKGFASYLFELRKEVDTEFEADMYVLNALEVAQEFDVHPRFDNLKDMVEWHIAAKGAM